MIPAVIVTDRGQLGSGNQTNDPQPSIDLLQGFLQRIQAPVSPPPGLETQEWVIVDQQETYEHARWLDGALFEQLLGDDLNMTMVRGGELKAMEFPGQAKAILALSGPFVALTDDDGRFQKLLEGTPILEQSIGQLMEKTGA